MGARKHDGTAVAWGNAVWGGGDASSVDLTNVADAMCGYYACVARKHDGTAVAWGNAGWGGDASSVDLTNVADAMCGGRACVARKHDGTAVAWGDENFGGDASGVDLTNIADVDVDAEMDLCDGEPHLSHAARVSPYASVFPVVLLAVAGSRHGPCTQHCLEMYSSL